MEELKQEKLYTCDEFMSWDESVNCELIDGNIFMMAPPRRIHQEISGELFAQLHSFLKGKSYRVFHAPFGVRLDVNKNDDTIVIPDITVVCDKSKLNEHGCVGAPDLVVEILSPFTAGLDRVIKFNKYLQAGVREYWLADPDSKTVTTHILNDGHYITNAYGENETINVRVLDGCDIYLTEVFAER